MDNKRKVELYENTDQIVNAAVDRIVVEVFNRKASGQHGQAILLTGCSPLAGTTSTCISLAIAMANTKRKILLVDCDVRKSIRYKKLNEEATDGLANYLLDEESDATDIDNIVYRTNVEDLYYIPCGEYMENATRILCSSKMSELIRDVKGRFDCIVFDLPSLAIVPDAQVLFKAVDGIVLLAALGETRKKQIKDAKRKIAPFADKYYGMIINKVEKGLYRSNIKDYDYYFVDKRGEQKLNGAVHRKYRESARQEEK